MNVKVSDWEKLEPPIWTYCNNKNCKEAVEEDYYKRAVIYSQVPLTWLFSDLDLKFIQEIEFQIPRTNGNISIGKIASRNKCDLALWIEEKIIYINVEFNSYTKLIDINSLIKVNPNDCIFEIILKELKTLRHMSKYLPKKAYKMQKELIRTIIYD